MLLASRLKWMHRLGMQPTAFSGWTRRLSMPVSVRTSTRPATLSGRSSQVDISIPP